MLTLPVAAPFSKLTYKAPPSRSEWFAAVELSNLVLVIDMSSLAPNRASAPPCPTTVLPEKSELLIVTGPNSASNPPPQTWATQPEAVLLMNRTFVIVRLDTVLPPGPVQPPASSAQP